MHEIQEQILKQLTLSEKSRYSSIKPAKIGGNQFSYHLKKVIDSGYVKKDGIYYSLTAKGENFADSISLKTFTKRVQPKIVTMIVYRDTKNKILLCKRDKQPFINKLSLPFGKTHLEERINEAAEREMLEKTGIVADKLEHRGEVYLVIYRDNELISHLLCHIFEGKTQKSPQTLAPSCRFMEIKDIDFKKCVPGTKEVISLVDKAKDRFFKEIFLEE